MGRSTLNTSITYKKKRETDKAKGHTDVFFNKEYIGYYISETSKFRTKGQNWFFCPKTDKNGFKSDDAPISGFNTRTKAEMQEELDKNL